LPWGEDVGSLAIPPASAVRYSLVQTAKANGLNPDDDYRYILSKLPYTETVEDIEVLLPWNVKAAIEKNSDKTE
jgi:hypothetical protein